MQKTLCSTLPSAVCGADFCPRKKEKHSCSITAIRSHFYFLSRLCDLAFSSLSGHNFLQGLLSLHSRFFIFVAENPDGKNAVLWKKIAAKSYLAVLSLFFSSVVLPYIKAKEYGAKTFWQRMLLVLPSPNLLPVEFFHLGRQFFEEQSILFHEALRN